MLALLHASTLASNSKQKEPEMGTGTSNIHTAVQSTPPVQATPNTHSIDPTSAVLTVEPQKMASTVPEQVIQSPISQQHTGTTTSQKDFPKETPPSSQILPRANPALKRTAHTDEENPDAPEAKIRLFPSNHLHIYT